MMEYKNNLPELPPSWVWTRVGEVIGFVKGKKPKNLGAKNELLTVPYINIKAFEKKIFNQFTDGNGCPLCESKDILIVWDGARCGLVGRGVSGAIGSTLAKLNCYEINSGYLFYFLQTKYEDINKRPKGIGIPHVEPNIFWAICFPFPPLPEQHRIVTKIEELFTKLDAGAEALKKIKTQLKRYRQSVLKSAMEGKLTEKWRETHKNEIGPPSLILKNKIKNIYKTHRKNLPSVEDLQSHDLPEKWSYATLPYLVTNERYSIKRGPFGGSLKKEYFVSSGYKVYEQQNVIKNDFVLGNYYIDEEKFQEMKAFEINAGDVLISCSGTIGRIAIVTESYEKGIINQALLKLTLDNNIILTNFFVYLFRNFVQEEEFFTNIKGVAIKNIASIKELKKIFFKLPPLSEQHKIVEEIEKRFSIADEVEKTVEQSLKQSERLRQSILKRAFEGKLVPQDPTDEPANVLLERIKKEKERLDDERKTKRKSRKKKTKKYVKKELM